MKKLLALLLLVATCFSLASCFGGGDYNYVGEWQVIAYRDQYTNRSIAIREESALNPTMTIEKDRITYVLNGNTVSRETYFSIDKREAVVEFNTYYTAYKKYGPLLPFGESLMLWQGTTDITATAVLLRRMDYYENFDPISKIFILDNGAGEMQTKLGELIGEYSSTLAALNMGYNNTYAFSVKQNQNDLSVTKEGNTIKFTDANNTWTVVDTALNPYFMGVELKMVDEDGKYMYITIMEVGNNTVCYVLNSTYSGNEFKYSQGSAYTYGVLVKK